MHFTSPFHLHTHSHSGPHSQIQSYACRSQSSRHHFTCTRYLRVRTRASFVPIIQRPRLRYSTFQSLNASVQNLLYLSCYPKIGTPVALSYFPVSTTSSLRYRLHTGRAIGRILRWDDNKKPSKSSFIID